MDARRIKAWWLIGFIVMVLMMMTLGGVTRLTRSGLSMTEWRPIVGVLPPLNEMEWQNQFALYKQTPEFQQINFDFNLEDYKGIYLWEYAHRLLGRLIFIYASVFGFFLWSKKILESNIVTSLSLLVALQGTVGWIMVKSGLNTLPRVSPYLLALHFFLAVIVLAKAYYHLSLMRPAINVVMNRKREGLLHLLGGVLGLQVFYGCLTSGLKAGFAFNTYPLMGGHFLPPLGMGLSPWWRNFFENPITVQWIHRWLGALTFALIIFTVREFLKGEKGSSGPFIHLIGITSTQVILGILTLVLSVPTVLAAAHQLIAALIVLGYLNIRFRLTLKESCHVIGLQTAH